MANQKLIDLSKKVKINLEKKTKLKIRAQVALLDDVSGSASGMHRSGLTQRLFDRVFAVAYEFDDNQVLDAWAFDTGVVELEPIVESMFGNYVQRYINENDDIEWGGTRYAPGMQAVIDHYYPVTQQATAAVQEAVQATAQAAKGFFGKIGSMFGKKEEVKPADPAPAFKPAGFTPTAAKVKLPDPVFCMLVTDGENSDEAATLAVLEANKDKQIFWLLIGIKETHGRPNFQFLEKMAKLFPNVSFYDAGEIDKVGDDELYDKLFTPKFINWYEDVRKGN
jgi:hypothetical protein